MAGTLPRDHSENLRAGLNPASPTILLGEKNDN